MQPLIEVSSSCGCRFCCPMAGPGSSMVHSFLLFTVVFFLQEMYRTKLASLELFTILGGFTSSIPFLLIGNFQESCDMRTGLGAVILAEAVALIAASTVHRVCITTWIMGLTLSKSESRTKRH